MDKLSEEVKKSKIHATALRFVLLIGILSFFADFTYEGSRSILGPYLEALQASAFAVGVVTGLGELLGYGLRLVSGRFADITQKYWPITIFGDFLQMISVPLLALTGSWPAAAVLIILERVGKATRNPPRDVMLSHAAKQMGYGWAFGLHEALDQFGALVGPLVVATVLAFRGDYHLAFAVLAIPAAINLTLVLVANRMYPHPENMEANPPDVQMKGLPRVYWLYLVGAVLVAAGFADFPLVAYHFAQASIVQTDIIPVFYAVAMGVSGTGSLVFGRLYDRFGFWVLIVLTLLSALFAPLVFLGGISWSSSLGLGDGRTRIHHPGCGGADGIATAASFGLWLVHRRVWHILVPGQRRDWVPLYHFHPGVDCLFSLVPTGGHSMVLDRSNPDQA